MFKKEIIKKFDGKQKFSPPDEKKPSPSDFAAGKPLRGILKKTKREDIQDTDHGKEHDNTHNIKNSKRKKITFGGEEIRIIDSSLDKNIEIKNDDTSFAEYLESFAEIVNNIENAFENIKQSLTQKDFIERCGSDKLDFKLISDKSAKEGIINIYNEGKKQGSKKLIDLSFDLIENNTNKARSILDNLNKLKRKIEQSRQH
jgi:hypothetical protein